jgi:hypothetical protein
MIHDWDKNDDRERIEVIKHVVGNSVRGQRSRLSVSCCPQSSVVDLLNGEEEKNGTSSHCTTDIFNLVKNVSQYLSSEGAKEAKSVEKLETP